MDREQAHNELFHLLENDSLTDKQRQAIEFYIREDNRLFEQGKQTCPSNEGEHP